MYRLLKQTIFGKQHSPIHIYIGHTLTYQFETDSAQSLIYVTEKSADNISREYTLTKQVFSDLLSYILHEKVGEEQVDIYFKGTNLEYHIDVEATLEDSQDDIVEETLEFIKTYWQNVFV